MACTFIDVLCTAGIAATLGGVALPEVLTGVDDMRGRAAARDLAGTLHALRMSAILHNRTTALRFSGAGPSSTTASFIDGNGDGVRSQDIADQVDVALSAPTRVGDRFAGVGFGATAGLPAADPGGVAPGADPIRFGASSIASFTPLGTASSGTVYLSTARGRQFAVRVFGETGRIRVLQFHSGTGQWIPISG